ncbi:hypothetical protein WK59_10180 [Burkholderia ubonensis]|uniref:hypothetical protein n=1 Tax=Burkholderia ubonensis TaxID=101571 RepID=UPI00075D2B23|nr:hypothetical protein [Burkholderia ubonensis]KVN95007.1 hypothetical protein WJ69_07335 [Burkholderia ubonensis]KVT60631.1 hypothetical protein WK55_09810 [Burkholderia ubonensis]KVT86360.1 hypothetical protein WK59_10180 [Burkholderia ubonensis]KVX81248.1 hypothetical protein WL08_10765 [Burkholderia ubonensis]KWN78350.1 hypothetical protein WM24_29680 [Burkholderia ubonensis]
MSTPENEKGPDLLVRTSETIAGDLIAALLQEFRLLPDIWVKVGSDEQDEIVERVRKRVTDNVRNAVHLIASGDRMTVAAELKKVTFADKVEAVFSLAKRDPAAMDLCHAQGLACLIVVADAQQFMGGADAPQKDLRQKDMFDGNDAADSLIEQVRRRSQQPPTLPPQAAGEDEQ